ncbi:MAG: phosphodiester glycosidase family protein [Patescibacteria group bacterium]|nr:phosphodiester glycosidase family protein [Patescibacteria group bacterium]
MKRYYFKIKQGLYRRKAKTIIIILTVLLLFSFVYIGTVSVSFFANAADYVVRPIIGSRNTVTLESLFFGVSDTTKQVVSKFSSPSKNVFANENTKLIKQTLRQMSNPQLLGLSPMPSLTSLHPFPNEGVWSPIVFDRFQNQILMAKTIVSPDPQRNYAYVALVKMAMSKLSIAVVAGGVQPGGPIGNPGTGIIPWAIASNKKLIAAFNGGFQYKDGEYGMTIGNKTYVPLRKNLATFVIYKNGSVNIIKYQGQDLSNTIATRQNGPMLIENGTIISYTENGMDTWGLTVTNSMYTWRSGIGITKNGNLIYAVGPSLIPQTLAKALQKAGAVNAMQLDINPYWVRFVLFHLQSQGTYSYKPLLHKMTNGGYAYLHGYQKDFFYIYTK